MLAAALLCGSGYVFILPGTVMSGVDVGGMTVLGAQEALAESLRWADRTVLLSAGGSGAQALLQGDLGVTVDLPATIRASRRPLWKWSRWEYPLVLSVDRPKLAGFAAELSARFGEEPRDAYLALAPGDRVVVVPEKTGRVLDLGVFGSLFSAGPGLYEVPEVVEIPFVETLPSVLARDLERFLPLGKIATFITYYAVGNDRAQNIALACVMMKEITVEPGEVFSFNEVVGPRTAQRGYRKAPTFVGEETLDDFGGGVCQVSTAVYVATLKAGFSVVERYCHARPVDYVPTGLDATVVYNYLDLKMRNSSDVPCLIRVTAEDGELKADVFGRLPEGTRIELETRILKEIPAVAGGTTPSTGSGTTPGEGTPPVPGSPGSLLPPDAPAGIVPGKPLRNGYLVETIRKYVRDGRVEKIERLNTSMYPPEKPPAR